MVSVPTGGKYGDQIQATSPDGQTLQFPFPAGALAGQLVPVLYTPLPAKEPLPPMQVPITLVGRSLPALTDTNTEASFRRAAQKAESEALDTAAMQSAAVKNVMQQYDTFSRLGDEESPQIAAYLKAKDAQKASDWEMTTDLAAAEAEAEAANYAALTRSEALQDTAMAKQSFASENADYSVVKANTVAEAGTDAAWKAQPGAAMQQSAPAAPQVAPAMQQSAPAMPQSAPAMPPMKTQSAAEQAAVATMQQMSLFSADEWND